MKRFFYLLLISIAILGLSGLNVVYADTGSDFDEIQTKIKKIEDFIQKYGHDVFEEKKTGREISVGLGWEQKHPEWTERINYHFLIKAIEIYQVSGETEIIFHRIWLSPGNLDSIAGDPRFQGIKETDLFFKAVSVHTRLLKKESGNILTHTGKIGWVFYYRDNLKEFDSLSANEAKDEFLKELHWWVESVDKIDKDNVDKK